MKAERPGELGRAMAACRRVWVGVGLFSACLNMLMLSVPLYMMQLYDRVLATRNVDTLLVLTAMVAVALVILGLLDALRGRIAARVGGWLDAEMGGPVMSGAVADALRGGGGASAQGLRDLATIRGYLSGPGIMPLFDAPWTPVFLAIVFLIHPVLGWIALGGAVVLFSCAVLNDLATRKKLAEAGGSAVRALNAADAAIRNADTIVAMGMLPNLVRRWQETGKRGEHLRVAATDASGSISAAAKVVRFGLQVAMLGVGAYLVILHEMTPGAMIAGAIILARGLAPLEQLISSWRFFTGAKTAYRRLKELMARTPDTSGKTTLPRPAGRIDVEKVSYVPPRRSRAVAPAGELPSRRRRDPGRGRAVRGGQDHPGASHRRLAGSLRGPRAPGRCGREGVVGRGPGALRRLSAAERRAVRGHRARQHRPPG